jgi:hypothetical protein
MRTLSRMELAANGAEDVILESVSDSIENPELSLLLVYTVVRDSDEVKVQPITEAAQIMETKQRINTLSDFSITFQIRFYILLRIQHR